MWSLPPVSRFVCCSHCYMYLLEIPRCCYGPVVERVTLQFVAFALNWLAMYREFEDLLPVLDSYKVKVLWQAYQESDSLSENI